MLFYVREVINLDVCFIIPGLEGNIGTNIAKNAVICVVEVIIVVAWFLFLLILLIGN